MLMEVTMTATFDETLNYLNENFLTLPELADHADVSPERILELIAAGCLPPHAHEAIFHFCVVTNISGSHETGEKRVRYYHPSQVQLTRLAHSRALQVGLDRTAAEIFDSFREEAFAAAMKWGFQRGDQIAKLAWGAFRDGTFGVCLKQISASDMIRKVAATNKMKSLLEVARQRPLSSKEHWILVRAIAEYESVTGPFGPHEIQSSSRGLVLAPAKELASVLPQADRVMV